MVEEEEAVEVAEEAAGVVAEEAAVVEELPQLEEPMRMPNYWEENPNILKEIDEMSTDSSPTLLPIST